MIPRYVSRLSSVLVVTLATMASATTIEPVPGQAELGTVEIRGVAAGRFDPTIWKTGALHLLPDVRQPLIAPRLSGGFRNIYAPSIVQMATGWRVFYGAWDGVPTGNDRIYSINTTDFLDFTDRRTVIEHGQFVHVCNVSAVARNSGGLAMLCTVYPDQAGLNKPGFFSSPDGATWNGAPEPYPARTDDIITIDGYEGYLQADINGINVLLHEDGVDRVYFCDFKQMTHVRRASGTNSRQFKFEQAVLASHHMVNDVKRFDPDGERWYLMGLHANTDRLWYALSPDGLNFSEERQLASSLGEADRYIVAIGWVVRDGRVLGFLYGAGAVPQLHRNRLFARWLQRKLVFTDQAGQTIEATGALGPDRQVISLNGRNEITGHLQVLGEDGRTPLGPPIAAKLTSGTIYQVVAGR